MVNRWDDRPYLRAGFSVGRQEYVMDHSPVSGLKPAGLTWTLDH